ncbi:hypothetical protein HPP92_002016 [Vanilla planifolia]|uniref:Uncharacterized protein n=1 Tax=Vanilla planifolia TaxID=51239 RepID=A0A835RZ42_VANPL|nr:hypothetical protein HPP92_002016 [Vanilla planifolia]
MVISGGSSSGRGLGIDRFYSPPALRRQLEQQRQQQLQETGPRTPVKPKSRPVTPPVEPPPAVDVQVDANRVDFKDSSKPVSSSSSASTSPSRSPPPMSTRPVANFYRFLECTTPVVPARYSPKECSAYGAGVPLVLDGCDSVVQYYVPYLSAIQIYLDSSKTSRRSRQVGAECDTGMLHDTGSDVSSESEPERAVAKQRGSLIAVGHKDHHGFGGENATRNHAMLPVFEYLERDPPYGREPLADKIALLANRFPQLKSYRSCDLLPSSWISVAWYPIYRIPTGPTLRDLDACFLTFHSLSTPVKNSCNGHSQPNGIIRKANEYTQMPAKLQLPVFGLASYKFKGPIWTNNGIHERQFASSLLQAAEKWLQLLKVDHPDFRFFLSHQNGSMR